MKKKEKEEEEEEVALAYCPLSSKPSTLTGLVLLENVCNPELDQQMQMTQNNCWVSGRADKVEEKIKEVKH